jgi:putative spermidine/putrescine transport system ATP-binding protein
MVRAAGTVSEVVYAGPVTRYVVRLDAAGHETTLIALQQNGSAADGEVFERGTAVDLLWNPEHVVSVPTHPAPSHPAPSHSGPAPSAPSHPTQ